ncbi:Aldose 1-epimerase precursor [Porphyromonas macacae]|uniref:Aldose 1-epimerase n=1 Tax=Porphyromonas macacae TaxID=28115 RepID=A0A379E888_9PORP|nr:aldose epimerase family protein [Porphyromonas macacae]SUB88908.1 Aldose 1-epimerase precursor [Porphyromonas macacae]
MNINNKARLDAARFVEKVDGKEVRLYTLTNKCGAEAHITNLGAKLVSLVVPSKDGWTDVVIGHDSIQDYIRSEEAYFGAICGRYANRIAKGIFSIDGQTYHLPVNNGPNSLHGGIKGFNAVVWTANQLDDNRLQLKYQSADGEEGYPGNLDVTVCYTLTDDNELAVSYTAETDKPTVLNLTNHAYFNLSGNGDTSIADHILTINAREYLPTDETAIPYGKAEPVAGTPMDFTEPVSVGLRIDEDTDQLRWARGYDHTYILDKEPGKLGFAACVRSPKTSIVMEVYTDQPGVQLYTGNWMSGNMRGKHDARYPARAALCLETQHFPDSPNKPEYPSTRLNPGELFESVTVFKFTVE